MKKLELRKNVLFDLDGTLLPMDMEAFQNIYFRGLCKSLPEFEPKKLVEYIWKGTASMVKGGLETNRERFADTFTKLSGMDYYKNEDRFIKYYETDFQKCKEVCPITDTSKNIVNTLRDKGYLVAIATNPIFPQIATYSRINWIGLDPKSFPLVTTFETSKNCKPNLEYYKDVLNALNIKAEETVMIGNDVLEDGIANKLGIKVILISDCLLNPNNLPTENFEVYTLEELYQGIKNL